MLNTLATVSNAATISEEICNLLVSLCLPIQNLLDFSFSSSTLLETTSRPVGVSSHPHPPKPHSIPPLLPLLPPPPSIFPGEPEEDILYQWRLRRRLEQAHRSTSVLSSRLNSYQSRPFFKSRCSRAQGYGNDLAQCHLLAPTAAPDTNGGGGGGEGEMGGEGEARLKLQAQTASADGTARHATGIYIHTYRHTLTELEFYPLALLGNVCL